MAAVYVVPSFLFRLTLPSTAPHRPGLLHGKVVCPHTFQGRLLSTALADALSGVPSMLCKNITRGLGGRITLEETD